MPIPKLKKGPGPISLKKPVGIQMHMDGKTPTEISHAMGVNVQTVYKWINDYRRQELKAAAPEILTEGQEVEQKTLGLMRKDIPVAYQKIRKHCELDDPDKLGSLRALALLVRLWREMEKSQLRVIPEPEDDKSSTPPPFRVDLYVKGKKGPTIVEGEGTSKPIAMLEEKLPLEHLEFVNVPQPVPVEVTPITEN